MFHNLGQKSRITGLLGHRAHMMLPRRAFFSGRE
jgi:hypothetical protein